MEKERMALDYELTDEEADEEFRDYLFTTDEEAFAEEAEEARKTQEWHDYLDKVWEDDSLVGNL